MSGSSPKDNEEFSEPRFQIQEMYVFYSIILIISIFSLECPSNLNLVVPLENGSYLLNTPHGQIYHIENESIKPIASFDFPVKV